MPDPTKRREARAQRRGLRTTGIALIAAALTLFLWPQITGRFTIFGVSAELLGWLALIGAWVVLLYYFLKRLRARRGG